MTYAENMLHVHYVSVIDGRRAALLVGPFRGRRLAEPWRAPAARAARQVDPWAAFHAFGTCRLTLQPGELPPPGKLNNLVGYTPPEPTAPGPTTGRIARHDALAAISEQTPNQ
jgi:hypothetical protein